MSGSAHWSVGYNKRKPTVMEIGYGSGVHFPQAAALHTRSGYLRLTCGPQTTWGTSVLLVPVVWQQGHTGPTQGAQIRITACQEEEGSTLRLAFHATLAGLSVTGRLRFAPPRAEGMQVEVEIDVRGRVAFNQEHAHEAFKMVMLSSMHLSDDCFDTDLVVVGMETFPIPQSEHWLLPVPHTRPLLPPHTFGLRGGRSRWQPRLPAPTILIADLHATSAALPVEKGAACLPWHVAGWVSAPQSGTRGGPNSDNVGMWAADASVCHPDMQVDPKPLSGGHMQPVNTFLRRSWRYTITATL